MSDIQTSFSFQKASFRGVEFHVDGGETQVGRRVQVHEFPLKDLPFPEDLGKKASEFVVEGFIIGENYIANMKRLIAALEQPGAGTLVHPSLGSLDVVLAHPGKLRERFIQQRGRVTFSLSFVERGVDPQPSTEVDTQQTVDDAADDCHASMADDFAGDFSTDGMPGWSIQSIRDEVARAAQVLDNVRDALHFDLTSLSQLVLAGNIFKANLAKLLATPGAFATEFTTLIRGMVGLFDFSAAQTRIFGALGSVSPAIANKAAANVAKAGSVTAAAPLPFGSAGRVTRPVEALLALASYGQPGSAFPRPSIPLTTAVRRRQAANQAAFFTLLARAAVVEAVRSSIYVRFSNADQAAAMRDTLYDALDQLMLDASDPVYEQLHSLRTAMVRDITERGGDLVRLSSVTMQTSVPARVLAYRLFGTGDLADEIIARNQEPQSVLHPLFVPGGRKIEVPRV